MRPLRFRHLSRPFQKVPVALLAMVGALTQLSCVKEATAPSAAPAPVLSAEHQASLELMSTSSHPCDGTARACALFLPFISQDIQLPTFFAGSGDIGAIARVWTFNGEQAANIGLSGSAKVHRGSMMVADWKLKCFQGPAETCHDAKKTTHTCQYERNVVKGNVSFSAWFGGTVQWYHSYSDARTCAGPTADAGCGDEDTRIIAEGDYDPYEEEQQSCGGGGGDPPGTQYEPGDNTGGETVDWGTGVGNGGQSVCGTTAIVEYVCLDEFNLDTLEWEEWGCGYVTTC